MLLVVLAAPSVAWAHASLVKSVPAQRAVLYSSPAKIQLWFNERLEARYSSVSLLDGSGTILETGVVEIAGDDPKSIHTAIKSLPPGTYTVKYRVLSTDGHVVENQFSFTIRQ
jgi:methionine-rich copper-binding protein CopC